MNLPHGTGSRSLRHTGLSVNTDPAGNPVNLTQISGHVNTYYAFLGGSPARALPGVRP